MNTKYWQLKNDNNFQKLKGIKKEFGESINKKTYMKAGTCEIKHENQHPKLGKFLVLEKLYEKE